MEGFVTKEEPTIIPDEVMQEGQKPGLNDTMVMTGVAAGNEEADADDSFAEYGEKEAEQLRQMQEMETVEEAPAVSAEEESE